MVAMNKYKKFLEEKISNSSFDSLPFFNANKLLKQSKLKKVSVRVLPRNKGELFFFQFKKHTYKVGTAFKNNFCMYSLNSSGEAIGENCPFCDFLKENKGVIDDKIYTKLSSKDAYIMAVYNYADDEIQKYEVNYYGITDILTSMQKLDDEFDPDEDGFDLIFEKDENGYAKVTSATPPEETLESIKKVSEKFAETVPDVENEVIPKNKEKYMKVLKAALEYAVKAYVPTFAAELNTDEDDEEEVKYTKKRKKNFDPNEDDDEEEDEEIEKGDSSKKSKMNVNDVDDEEDDDVEDIREFIRKKKKL